MGRLDNKQSGFACMSFFIRLTFGAWNYVAVLGHCATEPHRALDLGYRTTQGATPGQKWQKKILLQPEVQSQETKSTLEAFRSLNFSQDRETKIISHSETFARNRNICKHLHISAGAHVHSVTCNGNLSLSRIRVLKTSSNAELQLRKHRSAAHDSSRSVFGGRRRSTVLPTVRPRDSLRCDAHPQTPSSNCATQACPRHPSTCGPHCPRLATSGGLRVLSQAESSHAHRQ